MNGKDCTWSQNPEQIGQADLLIGYLAENSHHGSDIKRVLSIWQAGTGVRGRIANVPKAMPFELPSSLREHFRLQLEQFQTTQGDAARQLDTEVPGARAQLEHATVMRQGKAIRKLRWTDDDAAERIVDQP
jgi:hypothetical protein